MLPAAIYRAYIAAAISDHNSHPALFVIAY